MANGDLRLLGTLYMGGVPQLSPTIPYNYEGYNGGNIPKYVAGQSLEIRDSHANGAYRIRWREVTVNGKKILVAERNILYVGWSQLNDFGFITGKNVTIDGKTYKVRVLTGGTSSRGDFKQGAYPTDNEWDLIIGNEGGFPGLPTPVSSDFSGDTDNYPTGSAHNAFWNWYRAFSWGQEKITTPDYPTVDYRPMRGYYSPKTFMYQLSNSGGGTINWWRPVLEEVNMPPNFTQIPDQTTKKNGVVTLNLANYFSDADGDALSYVTSSSNPTIATATVSGNTLTMTGISVGDVVVQVDAKDGKTTTSQSFKLTVANTAPSVSLSSPSNNVTLYENDLLVISGSASDVDTNQSVTVYAQINNEQRIALAVGLSNAPVSFTRKLIFKAGKLYDGEKPITGSLADGVAHKLKVWAEDSEKAPSVIIEKSLYVVPNRAPLLTVDAIVPSGVVDVDKFKISGTSSDQDTNSSVKVTRRINAGNAVEIYSGPDGAWEFDVSLAQLQVGENVIVVEVVDNFGAKTSKTIKLNKNEVKTPILQSVARYKIEPPKGNAKGVLLFIERDKELDLKVELSMTLAGEQEKYETLTPEDTAPMSYDDNIVEDTFYYEATEPKDNIILKLTMARTDLSLNHKIHLISGAVE
ncbi:Ig-like domain-containing protein [Lysinibacillus xylanilyticus]|uniref:Ig-like domain-containing protein n=1 Tax=Lysinibacillus xylanilyticus TaxID=582475 RepID=UPI00083C96D6|nr:Ig-like domain-containing protein [Lysinibacillus xylanilyticus]